MELNSNNSENQNQDKNFEQVVAESKAKIQDDMVKKEPRKRGPYKKRGQATTEAVQSGPAPQAQTGSTQPSPQPIGNLTSQLKAPIQALSKLPAMKYQIPELVFDENEATMCAEAVNNILNAFIPDVNAMSPKTAAIMGGVLIFGSVGFNKVMIYQMVMTERRKVNPPEAPEKQVENQNQQNENPISANQLFRK